VRTNATNQIRALLRAHPDGLSTTEIAKHVNREASNTGKLLHGMPDTYIDRWNGPTRGQYTAIWCIVTPPDNCPHPTKKVVAVRPSRWKDFATDAPSKRTKEIND
jgi:hypothetical protein